MTEQPPATPTRLGPYEVVDRIAVGGMAEVFRAKEQRGAGEPRLVCIKRMLPHVAAEKDGLAMFEEEARLAARVSHPNVVELLGVGTVDQPYLALEYVPGCDLWRLTRWLAREGQRLDPSEAVFLMREMLSGLQAVHDAKGDDGEPLGIVHRDVSPSNILLSVHGDVKLGDFGIAKAAIQGLPGASNRAKGKLGYLAPEQVTGGVLTHATDVFAATVILAELLLGRPLFTGASELAVLLAIRDASIQPVVDAPIRAELKEVVAAGLAAEPADRIPSAAALRDALAPFEADAAEDVRGRLASRVQRASGFDVDTQRTPALEAAPVDRAAMPTPTTVDLPTEFYVVTTRDGERIGTFVFAGLVEAITTGKVGPDDLVRLGDGPAQPVQELEPLLQHLPMSSMTPITQDARLAGEPDMRRNLAGGGIVRAIAESALRKDSGLWLCEFRGVRKEIYVAQGEPEFVSSNVAEEMLGEFLVRQKVIERTELDMALAVLPRHDGRLGDTLVALGLVEPVDLFQHIARQVRERMLDLFVWEAGTAELYRGVPPPPRGFPLGLDVWGILDEGIGKRLRAGLEERRFRTHMLDSLERMRQLPSFVDENHLPPDLARLLDLVLVPSPLTTVVEAFETTRDPGRGYRIVLLALALELVQWV